MQLSTFHDLVEKSFNEGAEAQDFIPDAARRAALWLERNYTFAYMEHFDQAFEIRENVQTYDINYRIKKFKFFRIVEQVSTHWEYAYLKKTDAMDQEELYSEIPKFYWYTMSGEEPDRHGTIYLTSLPNQAYSAELLVYRYTDWPVAGDKTPWLLREATDVILAQTLMFLAPFYRDAEYYTLNKAIRDEGIKTLLGADVELQESDIDRVMEFGHDL